MDIVVSSDCIKRTACMELDLWYVLHVWN